MSRTSISASWTQPYTSFTAWSVSPQVRELARDRGVEEELIRWEAVDNIVQSMLTYPDAERIINTLTQTEED